jgi:signal transduction histidine kinase
VLQARLHALCDGVIPAAPEEFNKLLEQVEHLRRLVDDLHTLSVAESGRLSLHLTTVDLPALARDVLAKFASRLASYRMHTDLVVETSDLHVRADEDRLRQVLHNLIENALRYAHSGEWLEVALRAQGNEALIAISDAGPGLPESVKTHLFQRFQRSDASRNRATGGTGLGLAIVQTLTVLQGGRIAADRSARGGARFTIRLPLQKTAGSPVARGEAV